MVRRCVFKHLVRSVIARRAECLGINGAAFATFFLLELRFSSLNKFHCNFSLFAWNNARIPRAA